MSLSADTLIELAQVAGIVIPSIIIAHIKGRKRMLTMLGQIKGEVQKNGGASLADAVGRVEQSVARIETGLTVLRDGHRALASASDGYMWECGPDGACEWASPALCELFGLSLSEMRGNGWLSAMDGQAERERVAAEWKTSVERGLPYSATYRVRSCRGGGLFLARSVGHASRDPATGRVIWYFGTTERIRPLPARNPEEEEASRAAG